MTSEQEWLGQPVGEQPELPSMVAVCQELDGVALELHDARTALARALSAMADAKAQYDNLFPAMFALSEANTVLVREAQEAASELDGLRDANAELETRVQELQEDLAYERESVLRVTGERDQARRAS